MRQADRAWQTASLTTAEFSRQYFSGFAIEADLKVGGAFIARARDGSVHISGEVIECDPLKKTLSSLKSVLETGHAPAIRMAPPERMLAALREMGITTP